MQSDTTNVIPFPATAPAPAKLAAEPIDLLAKGDPKKSLTAGQHAYNFYREIEQHSQLGRDKAGQPYIIPPGEMTAMRLDAAFEGFLRRRWADQHRSIPGPQFYKNVIAQFWAEARSRPMTEMGSRVASINRGTSDETIGLHLGPSKGFIRIDREGWKHTTRSQMRFLSSPHMYPLELPRKGGDIRDLRRLLPQSSDDQFILIIAWLLSALRPGFPCPALLLAGPAGSGKSTTQKLLTSLIDPGPPAVANWASERDSAVTMANRWVVGIDNFDSFPKKMSNFLCSVVTGTAYDCRKLFADLDLISIELQRPLLLNGIDPTIEHDLATRSLTISYRQATAYRPFADVLKEFNDAQPRLLGCLLSGVQAGLSGLRRGDCESHRMADFMAFARAAGEGMGWWSAEDFHKAYAKSHQLGGRLVRSVKEHEPLWRALREIADRHGRWRGSGTALLKELRRIPGAPAPPAANALAQSLNKLVGQTDQFGLRLSGKCDDSGKMIWLLERQFTGAEIASEQAQFRYGSEEAPHE